MFVWCPFSVSCRIGSCSIFVKSQHALGNVIPVIWRMKVANLWKSVQFLSYLLSVLLCLLSAMHFEEPCLHNRITVSSFGFVLVVCPGVSLSSNALLTICICLILFQDIMINWNFSCSMTGYRTRIIPQVNTDIDTFMFFSALRCLEIVFACVTFANANSNYRLTVNSSATVQLTSNFDSIPNKLVCHVSGV